MLHVKWVVLRYGQFSDTGSARSQGARIRDVRVYYIYLIVLYIRMYYIYSTVYVEAARKFNSMQ